MFKRKKKEKSVILRFQGKEYTVKEGWFFHPQISISADGDVIGELHVKKNLDIEVVSIDV